MWCNISPKFFCLIPVFVVYQITWIIVPRSPWSRTKFVCKTYISMLLTKLQSIEIKLHASGSHLHPQPQHKLGQLLHLLDLISWHRYWWGWYPYTNYNTILISFSDSKFRQLRHLQIHGTPTASYVALHSQRTGINLHQHLYKLYSEPEDSEA